MSVVELLQKPIVQSILTVIVFYFILKIVNYVLHQFYLKHNEIHWVYLGNVVKIVIVLMCLSVIGSQYPITSQISAELLKSTSLIVAILGFAAQEVLRDVIAGMVISFSKPYNIGSRINISSINITGIVEDITLRHTVIKCYDNSRVIVPNSSINKDILKNSDYEDSVIGNFLEIGIGYESDIRLACSILQSVVLANPLVIDKSKGNTDKSCSVQVKELAENCIILKTTIWTKNIDDNFNACSDIRIELKEAFEKAGIQIPYTNRTVKIVNKQGENKYVTEENNRVNK